MNKTGVMELWSFDLSWSDGAVEYWSGGLVLDPRNTPTLHYSTTPIAVPLAALAENGTKETIWRTS